MVMDMTNFSRWDREFRSQNLYAFNRNPNGLLWLKVRAVCRSKQLNQFTKNNGIVLSSTKIGDKNVELFEKLEKDSYTAMQMLDSFLKAREHEWYTALNINESQLRNDLYKVHHYTWGGDRNNSLDKYLVSRYVKTISSFDDLVLRQSEIADNAWNYVQTSWYNNWTSYLIEMSFKRHVKVISAVGEIKSVDFFIDNYPVDLKVTFFPKGYLAEKLKTKLGKTEISWLREKAKATGVTFNAKEPESQQSYTIMEKLSVLGYDDIISELKSKQREVITEAQANTVGLMTWLYASQGEMRFGAENRLYVILVDTNDLSQSWKMKRAFPLIEPKIKDYLDGFNGSSLKKIDFEYAGKSYSSLADVIFVVKE